MAYGILLYMWRTVGTALYPKRSKVLLWGILPQILIVIPNIETLHSTKQVLRTPCEPKKMEILSKLADMLGGFAEIRGTFRDVWVPYGSL